MATPAQGEVHGLRGAQRRLDRLAAHASASDAVAPARSAAAASTAGDFGHGGQGFGAAGEPRAYKLLRDMGVSATPAEEFASAARPSPVDIAEMKRRIGSKASDDGWVSPWMKITQDRVDAFAAVTLDNQWIHTADAARMGSPFGKPIAHGFLSLSLTSALLAMATPSITGVKMGVNAGFDKVRFLKPVPVGGRVRVHANVGGVDESKPGRARMLWNLRMEIEGEKTPALVCTWVTLAFFE